MQKKVLIVDDEDDILEILQIQIEMMGFTVDTAKNGLLALEKIRNNDYLFVMTDLDMPEMNGVELIRAIREFSPFLPVGLCSGRVDAFSNEIASLVSDGLLQKPFSSDDFKKVISNLNGMASQWEDFSPSHHHEPVSSIMATKTISVSPTDSVREVITLLDKNAIGGVPVIENQRLVGIFTERDVLHGTAKHFDNFFKMSVSECMTKNPKVVTPTTSIEMAEKIMHEGHFRHLPVVENEKIVGILSSRDVAAHHVLLLQNLLKKQNQTVNRMKDAVTARKVKHV